MNEPGHLFEQELIAGLNELAERGPAGPLPMAVLDALQRRTSRRRVARAALASACLTLAVAASAWIMYRPGTAALPQQSAQQPPAQQVVATVPEAMPFPAHVATTTPPPFPCMPAMSFVAIRHEGFGAQGSIDGPTSSLSMPTVVQSISPNISMSLAVPTITMRGI